MLDEEVDPSNDYLNKQYPQSDTAEACVEITPFHLYVFVHAQER